MGVWSWSRHRVRPLRPCCDCSSESPYLALLQVTCAKYQSARALLAWGGVDWKGWLREGPWMRGMGRAASGATGPAPFARACAALEGCEKYKCYPPAEAEADCAFRALRGELNAPRGVLRTVLTADAGRILPRGHAEISLEACVMCLLYRYCSWGFRLSRSLPFDGGKTG
jgi:hypothetical protein